MIIILHVGRYCSSWRNTFAFRHRESICRNKNLFTYVIVVDAGIHSMSLEWELLLIFLMLVVDGFGHTGDIDLDEPDSSDASSDDIHLIHSPRS
jgi:hypothetical protein